ncbi:MAG: AraC family ligand binding domain-containing protein, partial [Clostridia bacterium]|nr:AraC family ligand binding domain-containing protein [Clostridia bacterium]
MYENIRVLQEHKLPLEIRFVGETVCDEKYIIKRKHSEIMSLEYIVDGKGVLEINGQTLYPKKGDIFLLTEGSEHKYYCDKNEPWHKYFVSFGGAMGKSLIESYIPPDTYLFDGCFIEKSFERIFDIAFNNDDFEKIQSLGGV